MMHRRTISLLIASAATPLAVVGGFRWSRRWGSTDAERLATYPGDHCSPHAAVVHTRAITIAAPPDAIWPWLIQIGQDRSGFFSYTLLENLIGCEMPEVHELHDDWQQRSVGDKVPMSAPEHFAGGAYHVVAEVIPGESLVLVAPGDPERLERGDGASRVWSLTIVPGEAGDGCRLIVRSRFLEPHWWLEPAHFVMERKMLRTIARLAEELASVRATADPQVRASAGPSIVRAAEDAAVSGRAS